MPSKRVADHPIDPIFLERWSPRAFDAAPMPPADLLSILEAARWAPSAYNIQPWRFLYSHRDDAHWANYLSLLDSFNETWAPQASALVLVLSDRMMPGDGERPEKPSRCYSFDAGAAWAQLALQATSLGYHAHAMAGIDYSQSEDKLGVPERYAVQIMIAIGRAADRSALPGELQQQEYPSTRLALSEIAFSGCFEK